MPRGLGSGRLEGFTGVKSASLISVAAGRLLLPLAGVAGLIGEPWGTPAGWEALGASEAEAGAVGAGLRLERGMASLAAVGWLPRRGSTAPSRSRLRAPKSILGLLELWGAQSSWGGRRLAALSGMAALLLGRGAR